MNGSDKHHMVCTHYDDGGGMACMGCNVHGEGFDFRPEGVCSTPWLTREELLIELAELQATIAQLETKLNNAINLDFERRAEIEKLKSESFESLYNDAIDEIERLKGELFVATQP